MNDTVRFGVSLAEELLAEFDELISRKGYASRSEAIRDLLRDYLAEEAWRAGRGPAVGTVTLVYDHHVPDLQEKLTGLQHEGADVVVSSLHVHLDRHRCLEVLVVRGRADEIRALADRLIGARGVKHGKLTLVAAGKELP
ncbi:MAG: nickel-responsive transcriptional regulator NikR [Candidatus Coatesbacteria bacterium]|nr:MAG: nickel-responsive transcriptional regulator NikR [Candidatus Coatesbacteria bacterium]